MLVMQQENIPQLCDTFSVHKVIIRHKIEFICEIKKAECILQKAIYLGCISNIVKVINA